PGQVLEIGVAPSLKTSADVPDCRGLLDLETMVQVPASFAHESDKAVLDAFGPVVSLARNVERPVHVRLEVEVTTVTGGTLGEPPEQVVVDVQAAVSVQIRDLLGDDELTLARGNIRARMGLPVDSRQSLRCQRKLAPLIIGLIETNVEIAVDQQ